MTAGKLQAYRLLMPHKSDCSMFNGWQDDWNPWCCPEMDWLPFLRDGRRSKSVTTTHLVYRCCDTDCPARLAVNDEFILSKIFRRLSDARSFGKPDRGDVETAHYTMADARAFAGMHPQPRRLARNEIRRDEEGGIAITMSPAFSDWIHGRTKLDTSQRKAKP